MKVLFILLICLSYCLSSKVLSKEKLSAACTNPNSLKGTFSKTYWQTGDSFEIANGGRARTYWIPFNQNLCYVPNVLISLNGFDLSKDFNQRLVVSVVATYTSGFYVTFSTWADTKVYLVTIDWIAVRP